MTDYSTAATGEFVQDTFNEEPMVKDVQYKSAEEAAKALGLTIISPVQDRRSGNKFLGTENPWLPPKNFKGEPRRGGGNPNGYGKPNG